MLVTVPLLSIIFKFQSNRSIYKCYVSFKYFVPLTLKLRRRGKNELKNREIGIFNCLFLFHFLNLQLP